VAAGTGMAEPHPSHEERTRRTPETFTQQWAQIRQHPRGWWDHLTEHDLDTLPRLEGLFQLRERADRRDAPRAGYVYALRGAGCGGFESMCVCRAECTGVSRLCQFSSLVPPDMQAYPLARNFGRARSPEGS
jgi:hypothetical protein